MVFLFLAFTNLSERTRDIVPLRTFYIEEIAETKIKKQEPIPGTPYAVVRDRGYFSLDGQQIEVIMSERIPQGRKALCEGKYRVRARKIPGSYSVPHLYDAHDWSCKIN